MSTALFALIGLSLAPSPGERLGEAERHFAAGAQSRADADVARSHFAKAAKAYDDLWRSGIHNAALAKNRARAHRLAGNLPAAIAALYDGLAVARYDRELQVELEDARAAVSFPHEDLASACRPPPLRGISTRMSQLEAFLIAGALWLCSCLAAARFAMTRVPGWISASGLALVALALLGWFWREDVRLRTEERERPWVVISRDSRLKGGNGESWPDRLKWTLPPGSEVRELSRRGGWIQVELASGAAGWIPESHTVPRSSR